MLELLQEVSEEMDNTPNAALRKLEGFVTRSVSQTPSSSVSRRGDLPQPASIDPRARPLDGPFAESSIESLAGVAVTTSHDPGNKTQTPSNAAVPMFCLDLYEFEKLLESMEARAKERESRFAVVVQEVSDDPGL